jgi:hypothetical protein
MGVTTRKYLILLMRANWSGAYPFESKVEVVNTFDSKVLVPEISAYGDLSD